MNSRNNLRPCGTVSAYHRHRYNFEQPCPACREAWATYSRELRQRRKTGNKT